VRVSPLGDATGVWATTARIERTPWAATIQTPSAIATPRRGSFVAGPRTQTFRRYIRTASGAATTMMARLHAIAANTLLVDANCPP